MRKFLLSLFSVFAAATVCAQAPFKTTTIVDGNFAEGTVWYTMAIGEGAKLLKDNAGAEYIALGSSLIKGADEELWCFVGNEADGYAIYNKQAGTGKVLASSKTMSAISGYQGTGGSTYPTMQDKNNLPSGYAALWDFAVSDKIADVNGYFMKIHGTDYAVNDFGDRGMLAFWAEGAGAGSTIRFTAVEATVDVLATTGTFTASNSNKTWHSKWESSVLSGFSLSANANNMTASGDNIAGYSGLSGTCTYTLTAPEGMVVAGYSFDFVNTDINASYELSLSAGGKSYKSSAASQNVSVEIEDASRTATFVQSGENKGITFSNFKVYIKVDIRVPEPCFEVFPTLTTADIPYRIPAIATAKNGNVIAVADYRHSRSDIGMAKNGRIDLRARISKDNGKTWDDIFDIIQGKGADGIDASNNDMYVGFGDPAIVADRESDRVLVISCSGNVSFPSGQRHNHQGIAHFYSDNSGEKDSWSAPIDRSEHIYAQFDNTQHGPVRAMFVGSGKISQSQYIKVGDYYRIYCAVLVKNVNGTNVNFVLYSDNFGESWTVLGGGEVTPIPNGGDEPKAEELPDGSVIISSRCQGGRYFNIFSYTDSEKAEGSWGTYQFSGNSNNGTTAVQNSTNGEIMFVPVRRKADDKKMYLALQSVPLGPDRTNVGIYYKELETLADFVTPQAFAADWDGCHQSCYLYSAYSTMTLQKDNNVGFLYEEDTHGTSGGGYTIVYKNYSIEYLTDSAYVYDAEADKSAVVVAGIETKLAGIESGNNYVGCVDAKGIDAVNEKIDAYVAEPTYKAYEAINAAIANMPQIKVESGTWYRIRNAERSNGTLYLNPENTRVSVAASNVSNAGQLFTFVGSDENGYLLYNGNHEYYLGPLGANETEPVVTADAAAAGKWKISSASNGYSSIICQNNTGSNTGLHLANDNERLVPWTNNAPASLWYIEPVDEFTISIDEYAAVCLPFEFEVPENVKVYVTAGEVTELNGVACVPIKEYADGLLSTVAAGTPVLLAAEKGEYALSVSQGTGTEYAGENALKGVLKSENVQGDNIFTLSDREFVKRAAASGAIAANTAYYVADTDAASLQLSNDSATSIDSVEADVNVTFYDLKGNVVEKPVRGIYVTSEGKKVVVL